MLRRLSRAHSSQQTRTLPFSTDVTQVSGTSSSAAADPSASAGGADVLPQKPQTAMPEDDSARHP